MSVTLRKAQCFVKLSAEQVVEDFDVMNGGRRVGRLYCTRAGTQPWCWNISAAVAEHPISGRAATQVLALKMLNDMYQVLDAAVERSDA